MSFVFQTGGVGRIWTSSYVGLALITLLAAGNCAAAGPIHVWEKQEVTLTSTRGWANAYSDVTVWVNEWTRFSEENLRILGRRANFLL
jgi:hypothetical protein